MRRANESIYISTISQVEVPAAMWRKHRLGEIQATDAALLCADFVADVEGEGMSAPRFSVIALVDEIVGTAARLVTIHTLRAYDAVQLATASEGFASLPQEIGYR